MDLAISCLAACDGLTEWSGLRNCLDDCLNDSPASSTLLLFLLSWSTGMEETRSARRQATTEPGRPFLPDAVSSMIMSIDF